MNGLQVGLQLFTLREETEKDMIDVLQKVAELGFRGVEFAGYAGIPSAEMNRLLKNLGLTAIGSHVRYPLLLENFEQELDYLCSIGGTYLVCPNIPVDDRKDWRRHFDFFDRIARAASARGIQFVYHNHQFEFELLFNGKEVFEVLCDEIPSDLLKLEQDTAWIRYVNRDPAAYLHRFAGRTPLVHIKDFTFSENGGMDTLELGRGMVDLSAIIDAAAETGVEWLIVEQDICANPAMECVETSMAWLKNHYPQLCRRDSN